MSSLIFLETLQLLSRSFRRVSLWAFFLFSLSGMGSIHAAVIYSTQTQIGPGRWQAMFTVESRTTPVIEELTLYFDYVRFANLQIVEVPNGWDGALAQPDNFLQSFGFFDLLTLESGLTSDQFLDGIILEFDYLATGRPESLPFEILDPATYSILENGMTLDTSNNVPEPGALFLFLIGLLAATVSRQWNRRTIL